LAYASGNLLATNAANSAATSNVVITAMSNSATSGTIFQAQLTQGYQYSVTAGLITASISQSANAAHFQTFASSTFTVPSNIGSVMGYKIDVVGDQNSSGAAGGRGDLAPAYWGEPLDSIVAQTRLYDTSGGSNVLIATELSGGPGAQSWTDFPMTLFANLTHGNTYKLEFNGINYTESNTAASCNTTFGWNVYTNNRASF